jgi:hypothetical protein
MTAPTTTAEAIQQAALGPSQVQVKGTMVTARSAEDLIAIANYQAAQSAAGANAQRGLRFSTIKPPGAG